jgi:hypothetical protein
MKPILCAFALAALAHAADLRFHPAEGGEFRFDTGVVEGKIREGGKAKGLTQTVWKKDGTGLSRSMGLLSPYRVFTTGKRYGTGTWDWPSEGELRPDGSLETRWAADSDRPFRMRAVYRWAAPAILDLELTVEPEAELSDFEVFLSSYFGEQFTRPLVYAEGGRFLAAGKSEGIWQMFPCGPEVLGMIRDGRWKIPPSPVDWAIRPALEGPLAIRLAPHGAIMGVVMARPADAYAVATPHESEGHYSLYLALFGRTLAKGTPARARARLAIVAPAGEKQALKLYRDYVKKK